MKKNLHRALLIMAPLIAGVIQLDPVFAQTLKPLDPEFLAEPGCPIELVTPVQSELELDASALPTAVRHYIDYKNSTDRQIISVKFRFGYIDADNMIRSNFHAIDSRPLPPRNVASQKWRGDVPPQTKSVKVRVVVVQFADGTIWKSVKAGGNSAADGFVPLSEEPRPIVRPQMQTRPKPPETAAQSSAIPGAESATPDAAAPTQTAAAPATAAKGEQVDKLTQDPNDIPPKPPVPEEVFNFDD